MRDLHIENAHASQVDDVVGFASGLLEDVGCSTEPQMQIEIAVEEMFLNIANYAYAPESGPVTVQVEIDENAPGGSPIARIAFIDCGIPFNPLDLPDPDFTLPAEERPIGGLGVYMTKNFMDSMTYERADGQNILRIEKRLRAE